MLRAPRPSSLRHWPLGRPILMGRYSGLLAAAPAASGDGLIGSWSPGIGDPTVLGWVTTVAYLATAALLWGVARLTPRVLSTARRERLLWTLLAAGFLGLGINKQLDLQSALTEIGRVLANDEGWYEERHRVQLAFIVVVAALGLAFTLVLFRLARETSRELRVALVGTALVVCFVVVRAAVFHHVDEVVGPSGGGVLLASILELGGIGIVFWGSYRRRRSLRAIAPAAARSKR